ncbi:MAG: CHAP domain-containing protein [Candidatus Dormibacteria bacterium]
MILAGITALLATGLGSIPSSQAAPPPAANSAIAALENKRAVLIAELAAMGPSLGVAGGAVGSAEAMFNAQQSKVLAARTRLDTLNASLLSLSSQVASNRATVSQDKLGLDAAVQAEYEGGGGNQVLAAVLSAPSFTQAMDRLQAAGQVSRDFEGLISALATGNRVITKEQTSIRSEFASDQALEGQLASESDQLLAIVVSRNAFFASLRGPARQIAAEIATIDNEIAYLQAGPHVGGGACGNHFAYGNCTWYVANRRCIPWLGNAKDWFKAAAEMGYKEGHQPVPGAVVTFWPGRDGISSLGHVAYVEAVGPAPGVQAGYFKLSEMNYAGFDRVDYRVIADNDGSIMGFIYGQ